MNPRFFDEAHRAVDHLFLGQDGSPTLVEVKWSTDTRIRRKVVDQLLWNAAVFSHWYFYSINLFPFLLY